MDLSFITLSLLDCMALGYFLAFVLSNTSELRIHLRYCSIDDDSLCVLMRELSKNAEASREAGVLQGVTDFDISHNKIGDDGIACIATALQTNTTVRTLNVSRCGISDVGAKSLARALALTNLTALVIFSNQIEDNGIACIATVLQTNSTMRKLNVGACDISDVGAETLARALAVNKSLHTLYTHCNEIGNNGIAHIATALETNNILKELIVGDETVTDEGAVLLSSALTTNRSMECLTLCWLCTNPDDTLKEIGECVRRSKLRELELSIHMPQSSGEAPVQWLQCVEVGGKKIIQSQEDSRPLQTLSKAFYLSIATPRPLVIRVHMEHVRQTLEGTAATVNTARQRKELPHISFINNFRLQKTCMCLRVALARDHSAVRNLILSNSGSTE